MAPPPPAGAAHRRRGRVLFPVRRAYPLHFVWYFSVWTLFLVIFCPVSPGVDRRRSHMRPVQNLPLPTPSPRGARRSLRTEASRNPEEHPANAAHGCKSESRSFPEPHEMTSEFPEPGPQDGARNQVGFHPPPSQADRDRRRRAGGVRTSHEKFSPPPVTVSCNSSGGGASLRNRGGGAPRPSEKRRIHHEKNHSLFRRLRNSSL